MFDYSRLRGRIVEKYGSNAAFAKAFPMSERTLSLKLTCKQGWSQAQIMQACDLLDIPYVDIPDYFFKPKVR